MKQLVIISAAALAACVNPLDTLSRFDLGDQELLAETASQVRSYTAKPLDVSDVDLRVTDDEVTLNDVCNGENLFGCTNTRTILVLEEHQNCLVVAHELIHVQLYQLTGDGDKHHKSHLFREISDICLTTPASGV